MRGALVAIAALAGCGGSGAGSDAGGMPDLAPAIDPRRFDCTSLGADGGVLPERGSAIPAACGIDPGCRTPEVSAHRGAGGEPLGAIAPEDTLAAYRAGIALGVEFVETDPRPTADGVLVNMHDSSVNRTTDGSGEVDQMTFAAVRALKIRADSYRGDFSCERVPTLTEILQTCRGRVVVLVDANKTDRVDLLVQAMRDADALDWAIFDTSSIGKIDMARAMEPKVRFMIRPGTIDEITMQLDHFAPALPTIVELHATERAAGAPIVHMRGGRVLSDVFVEDAAAAMGNLSWYGKALDDGVDILQSDRPDWAIAALRQRGAR